LQETLAERNYFLQAAPYLVREVKLLVPTSSFFWSLFWYFPGQVGYHLIYLKELMMSNYLVSIAGPRWTSKGALIRQYPGLKALHGQYGSVMSEAQMHDSRMNLNSLLTSTIDEYHPGMKGSTIANYVEFKSFIKDATGKITGAVCIDKLDPSQKEFTVKAKVVVNCAGVHADVIRKLDKPEVEPRIVSSRGTHLIFKKGFLGENQGFIVPETSDGRLLFVINYFGHPLVGTTDVFDEATFHCEPDQKEIDFLIEEIKPFLGKDFDYKGNLLSVWAG
jgi:glycerol-3-phosphate dehydrogenase